MMRYHRAYSLGMAWLTASPDEYKIHDCLFFLLPENVRRQKMGRCLAVFTLTRR